ncbi:MAG TPA: hypothetical protein VMP89_08890, partial [Solirubrobacteraceae bacterium]|nr:hypothetical protein [Solirubrobacteraceae bacterium]
MTALAIVFWACVALLLYTHFGYAVLLVAIAPLRRPKPAVSARQAVEPPTVSVIVAAYAEQDVIADRIANLRA